MNNIVRRLYQSVVIYQQLMNIGSDEDEQIPQPTAVDLGRFPTLDLSISRLESKEAGS